MSRLYFAYGSNLHPLRLAERAPASRPIGRASLCDHALRFHKRSADGSAKCDVVPEPQAVVHGALFELGTGDRPALAAAEPGYEAIEVHVIAHGRACTALAYRARADRIAPELFPYHWYRELVLLGARYHRLPDDYVTALARVTVAEDPDAARAAANDALCRRLRADSGATR